jgi:folate-dependent phosphoribosylglycinamide formyltransferase PurN
MNTRLKILLLTMDDPLYTYSILSRLNDNGVEFSEVCFLGNPRVSMKRIFTLLVVYGPYYFFEFLIYYIWWNLINNGRVNNLYKLKKINCNSFTRENLSEFENLVTNLKPDLIVSVFCNMKINQRVLDIAKFGGINLHQGVLPDYKGLMPIFYAKIRKENKAGSTIHIMNQSFDSGRVLCQELIEINNKENYVDIWKKLNIIGADNLKRVIEVIEKSNSIPNTTEQKDAGRYYSLPSYSMLLKYFIMQLRAKITSVGG